MQFQVVPVPSNNSQMHPDATADKMRWTPFCTKVLRVLLAFLQFPTAYPSAYPQAVTVRNAPNQVFPPRHDLVVLVMLIRSSSLQTLAESRLNKRRTMLPT